MTKAALLGNRHLKLLSDVGLEYLGFPNLKLVK